MRNDNMNVLVLGATGGVGQYIVKHALSRGHTVTALVRNPEKLKPAPPGVKVLRGDVLYRDSVAAAIAGQAAVIYSVGTGSTGPTGPTTLFSASTRILLDACAGAT